MLFNKLESARHLNMDICSVLFHKYKMNVIYCPVCLFLLNIFSSKNFSNKVGRNLKWKLSKAVVAENKVGRNSKWKLPKAVVAENKVGRNSKWKLLEVFYDAWRFFFNFLHLNGNQIFIKIFLITESNTEYEIFAPYQSSLLI